MLEITPREIAQLTPAERSNIDRFIGEQAGHAALMAARTRNRAIQQVRDEEEFGSPDMQVFADPDDDDKEDWHDNSRQENQL